MLSPIVTNYVDASLAQLQHFNLMRWPGKLPDLMKDDTIKPSNDWLGWKAIPSTVTDDV